MWGLGHSISSHLSLSSYFSLLFKKDVEVLMKKGGTPTMGELVGKCHHSSRSSSFSSSSSSSVSSPPCLSY